MTTPTRPKMAAKIAGVQPATLRQWVRRGHISPPDHNGCYDLTEIETYSRRRDTRHFHRAIAGRRRRGEPRAPLKNTETSVTLSTRAACADRRQPPGLAPFPCPGGGRDG